MITKAVVPKASWQLLTMLTLITTFWILGYRTQQRGRGGWSWGERHSGSIGLADRLGRDRFWFVLLTVFRLLLAGVKQPEEKGAKTHHLYKRLECKNTPADKLTFLGSVLFTVAVNFRCFCTSWHCQCETNLCFWTRTHSPPSCGSTL